MSRVDLHIHTRASDGKFSPAEVVVMAAGAGMKVIAITDHDSVSGIAEAIAKAKSFPELTVIPGVEVSTDVAEGEVHILGYFVDYRDSELNSVLARMGNARRERAEKMVSKLGELGIKISWSRVQEIAGGGTVGRPHVAQAMLERGYISTFKEAFAKYIGRGLPAYVEWKKQTPAGAVELILKFGGLPVLAHPFTASDPTSLTAELRVVGLVGIEAYYNGYSQEETSQILNLARTHHLIATGGSDFHGLDSVLETPIGGAPVPAKSAERLMALARERNLIRDL
ncbi:MAG: PHP domain-containing protein [Chloroflexota bacterium]